MKKLKISSIYKNNICFFLISLLFCLYTSCYLGKNQIFINSISVICFFLSFIILFLFILRFKFNKFNITLILFFIILFIATISSEYGDSLLFIKLYIPILSYILYIETSIELNYKMVLNTLSNLLILLVFINFITIILFKDGLYANELYSHNWFLKYDNMHSFIYFPAILITYLNTRITKKNNKFIFLLIIVTFCILYCFSANTVVAYSLFLVLYLLNNINKKILFFNSKNFLIIHATLFFSIVVFRIQNAFSWFIVGVLHKNTTFSDRIFIWDKVLEFIKAKPLLGYGIEDISLFSKKIGSIYYTHAHNTYLDILYKGGIFTLVSFVYLIFIVMKKLYQYKSLFETKIVSCILFCTLLMCIFESREDKLGLYIILLICYYIDKFIKLYNFK